MVLLLGGGRIPGAGSQGQGIHLERCQRLWMGHWSLGLPQASGWLLGVELGLGNLVLVPPQAAGCVGEEWEGHGRSLERCQRLWMGHWALVSGWLLEVGLGLVHWTLGAPQAAPQAAGWAGEE